MPPRNQSLQPLTEPITQAEQRVIDYLLRAGFVTRGRTDRYTAETEGGKKVAAGDRKRYWLPPTNVRVTVGPKSTVLYRVSNSEASNFERFETPDFTEIRVRVRRLVFDETGHHLPHSD
jgi:hypothetical protein